MKRAEHLRANQVIWDSWTSHQAQSGFYDLRGFRQGGSHLRPYEVSEIGDVTGKDLLHLQCRFGTETLCWARLGANVTGVDFSPSAIGVARELARETQLEARFVASDIYALDTEIDAEFDIVYTSRGVVCWLPELDQWAEVISRRLRPGGFFYITDIHPVARIFANEAGVNELEPRYDYFGASQPLVFPASRDKSYVRGGAADEAPEDENVYCWTHTTADIVTALAQSGLHIDYLHEFPFCDWELSFTRKVAENEWQAGTAVPVDLPLFFSLRASRQ